MTIKTVVEFAQAVEDGKEFETYDNKGLWSKRSIDKLTIWDTQMLIADGLIRVKQAPQKIDLSFLIDSGIDCEFWDRGRLTYSVGKLESIKTDGRYTLCRFTYAHCRPRMNEWLSSHNLEDNQNQLGDLSRCFIFERRGTCYKITGIKEGYTL